MDERQALKKLKPCPLCGSKVHIYRAENGNYEISCTRNGCIIMPSPFERTLEEIVQQWNDRRKCRK